jgi:flagellar biosynthesis/type III secretory pathway protein FliH
LVAGDELQPDEVQAYSDCGLGGDSNATILEDKSVGAWRQVEFESIDIIEFAPLLVLLAAQEKSQAMVAEAEAQAKEIREQARRRGEAEGRETGKRELLPCLVAFADAGQSLIIFEERLISRYAPHIVQLALEIAGKVIGHAVQDDGQIAASILERAKNEVADAKQMRICLHPDDLQILEELRPDLVKLESTGGRSIEIVSAPEIGRGGCRLETESGIVDATIPTQLDEIRRQLLDDETLECKANESAVIPSIDLSVNLKSQ